MSYIGNEPIVSATRTVTEITATAGQTTFTANGGYTVGFIDVFVNGAQLQTSDFTATNGSSITLNSGATTGDDIRLVAWGTFSTSNTYSQAQVDSKIGAAQFGMKNRLIDAGFIINQRVYVSGTSLASGVYGHDRWKGGASGGTYTFTQGSLGVPITITITAGSLQQVIEGCNVSEGGTYVLSWTGTAQGRFNGGTYGSSPLAVTGLTAGANLTIEFNTGTLSKPQLEVGSSATSFDTRAYGTELAQCQRYYQKSYDINVVPFNGVNTNVGSIASLSSSGNGFWGVQFKVTMRATPTVTTYSFQGNPGLVGGGSNAALTAATYQQGMSGFNVSSSGNPANDTYCNYTATAEL